MQIPYVNLALQHETILAELISAVEAVLKRGDFISGRETGLFEEKFAAKIGTGYAIGTNSGTDALFLTLKALNIGEGDEVVTVPNSFVATAAAIRHTGAVPVFVDVDKDQNINPDLIEKAVTPGTKAILPVHLTGRPARMDVICDLADHYRLPVIEDCAQAIGAKYKAQTVGTFGRAGCFSLHPLKTLNACGDAGIIVTDDEHLYNRLKRLRNHGLVNRDECAEWGYNSRLDTLQAAILNTKLAYVDQWIAARRRNARAYIDGLSHLPMVLPDENQNEHCVYSAFVIQTERRNELRQFLTMHGIGVKIHYPVPIHLQKAAHSLPYCRGDFPVAEKQSDTILSLPVYPDLSETQRDYIIQCLNSFFNL